ncbi:hypothetical protein [Cypionkella sp.]|uniref:hypothetical protein n=1 Tax=Cypionkella sp. TaxID=2811411 RepID=UPI002639026C|nr:hypothetical protein [Cypionkella sp.]MDB5664280.1 hypothetical protein [Cypionkella sp.]
MFKKASVVAAAILATSLAWPAFPGPIVDKATEIEELLAASNPKGALEVASTLSADVWDSGPDITIREAALVDAPVTMLGIYNPRQDDKYQIGAPILIYAEPSGYGYRAGGDGLYSFGFLVDLRVMTEAGEVLGELPSVAKLDVTSRAQNREFPANLTYTLTGLAPGRYVLETTLRDKNSQKAGTFQISIEIVAPPAAAPAPAEAVPKVEPPEAAQPEGSEEKIE